MNPIQPRTENKAQVSKPSLCLQSMNNAVIIQSLKVFWTDSWRALIDVLTGRPLMHSLLMCIFIVEECVFV